MAWSFSSVSIVSLSFTSVCVARFYCIDSAAVCLHFAFEFCDHVVKPPHSCDIRGKKDFPEEQSSNSISYF